MQAFLDSQEKEFGDSFISAIETAICSASVHVAIFSKGYAESPWCLAELVLMLHSHAKIIPVFYGVKPWELRHIEKGVYASAFSDYRKKYRHLDKLKEWEEALQSVSFTIGYEFHNSDLRDCKSIVSAVLKEVQRAKSLHVAKYPVGLDKLVEDFKTSCLDELDSHMQCRINKEGKEAAEILGIFGIGGVGKTTLSKELYNQKRSQYTRSCFLFDVREASEKGELSSLQTQLLRELFHYEPPNFHSTEDGTSYIKNCIRRSSFPSFLIVLDDIDHVKQLDVLSVMDMVHKFNNSLVIVTTRDVGVLIRAGITFGYNLKGMNRNDARALFCSHALGQPRPAPGYEDMVETFIDISGGLPLSLEVLGTHVHGRTQDYWQLEFNKASKVLPQDIKKRLKISFDALDSEEKQIFMDVACFFIGKSKRMAIQVWNGSGWSGQHGLETLKNKCLVEEIIDYSDQDCILLRMHDHLRDLGREMANELTFPLRLWGPQHLKSLESKGFESILAQTKGRCFNSIFDRSMNSQITFFLGESDDCAEKSAILLWLQLDVDHKERKCIPSWIPLQNLETLRISGGLLKRMWQSHQQPPSQLKELQISQTILKEFPDLSGISNHLETVVLAGSEWPIQGFSLVQCLGMNLGSLDLRYTVLHGELVSYNGGERTAIKTLDIKNFKLIGEVVLNNGGECSSARSPMRSLENLKISNQKLVTKLLIHGNHCPSLQSLRLQHMQNLIEVELISIKTLTCLKVHNCKHLKRLSGSCTSLLVFEVSQCPELEMLAI
ncbi:disease resistance protein Roq1 isoform X2 [Cryptomeria japonica]|nr:disease resistance protein Roq1 isoform X2 [Cryptomeria japonica]